MLPVSMWNSLGDLQPGELIHDIGDAHVYLNHVDALTEQVRPVSP